MNTVVDIQRNNSLLNPVLITGCIIILVSFAIRSSFGLFQIPISEEFGWYRADFSFAIAIQNLFWGIGQPIFSAIAEKFGDRKAIVGGGISYALGLALSSYAITPGQHQLLEILVGFGIAGTGFGVILAVVGRASSDKNRSMALGIATAAGSVGQIIGPMLAQVLLQDFPWQSIFLVFACFILLSLFVLFYMRVPPPTKHQPYDANLSDVIFKAIKDPSFILIFFGFFSCGYQLAFITAHFPAFITEMCSAVTPDSVIRSLGVTATSTLGAISISLIGLANIGGTILAGWLGNIYSRKLLLGWIYVLRTIVSWLFIVNPITPESVVLFSILMGSLWLATVPLTAGLVGKIYGLRYMGTLFGLIFFSHQLGGFLGVWLGGLMYDLYGNYMLVWWVGVGMGAFSAIVHFLVDERPWLERQVKVMA